MKSVFIYFSSASRKKDYDVTRSSVCGGILKGWCVGSGHVGISYKDEYLSKVNHLYFFGLWEG